MPQRRLLRDGLDLNAPADIVNASDEVISLALVSGLGNRQSQAGGFAHKGEFGKVSSLAVIEFGWVAGFVEKEWFGR